MPLRFCLAALAALCVAAPAHAEFSYDYAEAFYASTNLQVPDPADGEGDGPKIAGSWELPMLGWVHLFGSYGSLDFDHDNFRTYEFTGGVGVHRDVSADASVYLRVGYAYTDFERTGLRDFDQDGYIVKAGYRARNHTQWEFLGEVGYVNVERGVDYTGGITLLYDFTQRFSAFGGFDYSDDAATGFLGVRFRFHLRD